MSKLFLVISGWDYGWDQRVDRVTQFNDLEGAMKSIVSEMAQAVNEDHEFFDEKDVKLEETEKIRKLVADWTDDNYSRGHSNNIHLLELETEANNGHVYSEAEGNKPLFLGGLDDPDWKWNG